MRSAAPVRPWTQVATLAIAALGAVLARLIGGVCLRDVPHVMDEIAYLLQAKTFATGHLVAPVASPRGAFTMWFVEDRWARYSIFPPGWPAVLALGVKVGAARWVNPMLHGLTTWLVGTAGRRLGGEAGRVGAATLYAFSPQALLLASSLMSHALVAACAAVVLVACTECALHGPRSGGGGGSGSRRRWLVAAGAALGVVATTRPLCACALLVGLVAAAAYGRVGLGPLVRACVPLAACAMALGSYNAKLTGSPARFPQTAYFDDHLPPANLPVFRYRPGCNDLGFGPTHGCEYSIRRGAHDLANALSNAGDNLQAWLLLAGGGPLVFLFAAYALRGREDRTIRLLLLAPTVAVVALYGLYWYAGTCYGARFYHAGLPALLLVAALGLWGLQSAWLRGAALALWLAWNAYAIAQSGKELRRDYWGTDDRFVQLASHWDKAPALVMVAFPSELEPMLGLRWTAPLVHDGKWLNSIRALGALGANSPALDGPVVFAKFHPALVDELRERFPSRELWIYKAEIDPAKDRLEPYDRARLPLDEPNLRPPDNFDGYQYDGEGRNAAAIFD